LQRAQVRFFQPSECLASALTSELCGLSAEERLRTQVVLPTARLANRISAQACQKLGAWYEPRFLTFESFIDLQGERLDPAGTSPPAASDSEALLLLGHLIRSGNFRHVNVSHVSELRQLFSEFEDWRYQTDGFDKIREVLAQNNLRSDGAVANLLERVDEVQQVYEAMVAQLAAAGRIPARRRQLMRADLIAERIIAGADAGVDRIIMAGITSVMPWAHNVLAAMANHWPLTVWLPQPSDQALDPVRTMLKVMGFDLPEISDCPPEPAAAGTSVQAPVTIHHATGTVEEAAAGLNLVDEAIAAGVLPADIGILVTDDHAYARPLRALLQQKSGGFTCNAAITHAFAASQTGSWLAALSQLRHRGEDAAALTAFLTHPVTLAWLKQHSPEHAARPGVLLRADLIRALCNAGVEQGISATAAALADKHRGMSAALETLYDLCQPFLQRYYDTTLAAWIGHLTDLSTAFNPVQQEDRTRPGLKLSVAAALADFCETVRTSIISTERADAPIFFEIMATHLLPADIRDTGDQLAGVQILSVEEARFIPFRVLIILGCNEGSLPRAIPRDYLFDNYLKTKIGLPGWQAAEAIELSTFRLLKARTPNLHLFYSENPADGLKVRSRIIDDLRRSEPVRDCRVEAAAALAPYIAPTGTNAATRPEGAGEQARRVTEAGKFAGERPALLERLSATSLEALLKCPYRFLLRQLGVRELELPEEDDLRKEGDWLHAVLEAFFAELPAGQEAGSYAQFALDRLIRLTGELCPPHLVGSEAWVQARTIGWPAFARHVENLYRTGGLDRCALGARELAYATGIPLTAETPDGGAAFAPTLRGKIDSIDTPLPGVHLITDYKRSGSPARAEVLAGRSPQLTLYAAALDRLARTGDGEQLPETLRGLRLENTIIGYWSILKGEFTAVAAGSAVADTAQQLGLFPGRGKTPLLEDAFADLQAAVGQRKQEFLTAPVILPDPGDCQFCGFSGVCRKDDPDFRELMRQRAHRRPEADGAEEPAAGGPDD
jgi:inactivated superfamily I helicase